MKNACYYFWWQVLWFYGASGVLSLSLSVKNWQLMYKLCPCHTFHAAPQSDFRNPLAVYLVFVVLKCFCPHCTISYSSSLCKCLCGLVCRACGHLNNAVGIRAVLALRVSRFVFVALLLFGGGFIFIQKKSTFLPVDSLDIVLMTYSLWLEKHMEISATFGCVFSFYLLFFVY